MSERKQALVELRDRVKAGSDNHEDFLVALRVILPEPAGSDTPEHVARGRVGKFIHYGAFTDAAKALHEAVLPDEGWEICRKAKYPGMIPGSSPYPFRAEVGWGTVHVGNADNPARAWLTAILEALIVKENADDK